MSSLLLKLFLMCCCFFAFGKTARSQKATTADLTLSVYVDDSKKMPLAQIKAQQFKPLKSNFVNIGFPKGTLWIKLKATRPLTTPDRALFIQQPRIIKSSLFFFDEEKNKYILLDKDEFTSLDHYFFGTGYKMPQKMRPRDVLFLKITCNEAVTAKIGMISKTQLAENVVIRHLFLGLYMGIMLVMFCYNLFLYVAVREKSYLVYIIYILFTWLAQISIQGYGSLIWPEHSLIDRHAVIFFSTAGVIFASLFTMFFLNTRVLAPKFHKIILLFVIINCFNLLLEFIVPIFISFIIMQLLTLCGVIIALLTSYHIYANKKFKPAKYYLAAWSVLLVGALFFILKDYQIIPYNNFTTYLLQIASSIEVTLLSFALADKINHFKEQHRLAQAQTLQTALENQRLISEQNTLLELKVKKRTEDLENANDTLNTTLNNLKAAQAQLVDAEKMAALGQLTAGIAHEINNPINFVTSNVKPLELDINDLKDVIARYEKIDTSKEILPQLEEITAFKQQIDLKFVDQEITSLLKGISEGAARTAEIIRSLRNFSRLDEAETKPVDLNEGLQSTLVLVRNNIPHHVTLIKDFGALPLVDCMPGKINQVFMNLVTNALQAINSKTIKEKEEFLTIKSYHQNNQVFVSIKDTGSGMSPETKHRIFEPFFTTKDIGEGTGLGLSIVFSIIEKHRGHIEVITNLGEGTEFIIILPVNNTN